MTHRQIFVVYDANDRIVEMFARQSWALRKKEQTHGGRIETYVHERDKFGIEMARFMNKGSD